MSTKLTERDSLSSDDDEEAIETVHLMGSSSLGAPLERINPLGTDVQFLSAVLLPLSSMLGMGVVITFCGLGMYMELASRFPGRSGGDAVFLEQAYPRPRYMVATVFGIFTAMRYNAAITATVFAEYTMHALDVPVTPWRQKGLAIAMVTLVLGRIMCGLDPMVPQNNQHIGRDEADLYGIVRLAVLLGMTPIEHPIENLRNPFAGSQWGPNALATGYLKVDYTYGGWNQAVNFLSEVQSQQGGRTASSATSFNTIRRASYVAVSLASMIYLFINLAFFAALPKTVLSRSDSLVGVLFFESIFGKGSVAATRIFPLMVALSCLGGSAAYALGQARTLRETARQGVLPYPELLSSTWPLGTPLGPLAIQWVLSVLVIAVPTGSESFSFLVSMHIYPTNVSHALARETLGVWNLRAQLPTASIRVDDFRASSVSVFVYSAKSFLSVIIPWIPPSKGSPPGTWYAAYCLVGIGIITIGLIYYSSWMWVLPKLGKYEIVQEKVVLEGGAITNTFKKVPRKIEAMNAPSRDDEALEPLLSG
ncbi:hypothetical protein FRB96_003309 [Tulasnella sp. 330]|nr:hypothetical protein FRB96_003309 [Tulasnella sp. 330]